MGPVGGGGGVAILLAGVVLLLSPPVEGVTEETPPSPPLGALETGYFNGGCKACINQADISNVTTIPYTWVVWLRHLQQ